MTTMVCSLSAMAMVLGMLVGPALADSATPVDTRAYTECSGHCMSNTPVVQAAKPAPDMRPVVWTEPAREQAPEVPAAQ